MTELQIPYFDRSKVYNAEERFAKDPMQKLLALFLSSPENYAEVESIDLDSREEWFFYKFRNFADDYIHLTLEKNFDTVCYFRSLSVAKAGATNICGGGGRMSNSSKRYFKDRHMRGVEQTKQMTSYLADKYRITPNMRVFLGHREIWKSLSPEALALEGWEWINDRSYSDPTFQTPMPKQLDSDLVPLAIRCKAIQKWTKIRRDRVDAIAAIAWAKKQADEEEKPETVEPKPTLQMTPELQKLLEEEEW